MSYTGHAITIIGYLVNKEILYCNENTTAQEECICDTNKNAKYCSNCGMQFVNEMTMKKPIDGYYPELGKYYDYDVYDDPETRGLDDDMKCSYICLKYRQADTSEGYCHVNRMDLNLETLASEIKKFKKKIELLEPWDPSNFGIYNIFDMDY